MRELALEAICRKHELPSKSYLKCSQQKEGISTATPVCSKKLMNFPQWIEEVKDNLIEKIAREEEEVKDALKSRRGMITTTIDFEDFEYVSPEEIGTPPIPDDNTKLIFEDLQSRATKEEEKAVKKCQLVAKDFVGLLGTTCKAPLFLLHYAMQYMLFTTSGVMEILNQRK